MVNIFKVITPALEEAGASIGDVVSTRLFASDISKDWEELGAAHAEIMGDTKPACTLVGGALLMPWMKVEVEVTTRHSICSTSFLLTRRLYRHYRGVARTPHLVDFPISYSISSMVRTCGR